MKDKEHIIEVRNLCKSYGDFKAVDELSFTVGRGEIFGLLGPNGAGKTTTLECLTGLRSFDEGKLITGSKASETLKPSDFEKIGVQFQEAHYPDLILVGELCIMTAALYRKPQNWRTMLKDYGLGGKEKKKVASLSGGERQKLSLILALINRPELVFLDELTTGLDPRARREVWNRLKTLKSEGLTVVLTSHFMDEVSHLCDRILIMKEGREVISGTPDSIITRSGCKTMEEAYLYYTGEENSEDLIHIV